MSTEERLRPHRQPLSRRTGEYAVVSAVGIFHRHQPPYPTPRQFSMAQRSFCGCWVFDLTCVFSSEKEARVDAPRQPKMFMTLHLDIRVH